MTKGDDNFNDSAGGLSVYVDKDQCAFSLPYNRFLDEKKESKGSFARRTNSVRIVFQKYSKGLIVSTQITVVSIHSHSCL